MKQKEASCKMTPKKQSFDQSIETKKRMTRFYECVNIDFNDPSDLYI